MYYLDVNGLACVDQALADQAALDVLLGLVRHVGRQARSHLIHQLQAKELQYLA